MVTTQPSIDVLKNSWDVTDKTARIDTSSFATYLPSSLFDFIMEQMMEKSIGYFWDSELKTYVVSCDQQAIMNNMYIRFAD